MWSDMWVIYSRALYDMLSPFGLGSDRCFFIDRSGQSAINGGSAPGDNLYSPYSPERQWSLGHIDEPQRQISSEDLVT